jgi:transcriptional regulator
VYLPPAFSVSDREMHFGLIEANPLGLLISHGETGLAANHVPFLLDRERGVLQAHLARANTQWRDFTAENDALVVFQSADHYITPSWYASKREHGKVVPTWNYVAVHVRGKARAIEDADWLRRQIDRLTEAHEYDRAKPWATTDAPAPFIESQLKGIIGLEVTIAATEGKWKVSQNRPEADRNGVAEGLEADGTEQSAAMAREVRLRG